MLIGVYISSLNKGVSCTGWPLCPNGFEFPPEKFFYEHFHRLLAISAAIFIGILVFIRKSYWELNKLVVIIVTTLIIAQIVMGMFVVSTKLNPILVAIHLSTAVTIFSLIFVLLRESYIEIKRKM
jgi:cytochrome c oxidase assembly protein subunit 15